MATAQHETGARGLANLAAHVIGWPWAMVNLHVLGWQLVTLVPPLLLGIAGLWTAYNGMRDRQLRQRIFEAEQKRKGATNGRHVRSDR
jgi:hypothetical protein